MTRYVVVGAGAIGCYVGGALALAGAQVSMVGRPRLIEALQAEGLTVSDLEGRHAHLPPQRLTLASDLAELKPDPGALTVILLCVKGGATLEAARQIAAAFAPGSPVVSLQNGVENLARIRAAAPGLEAIAGMVPFNVVQPAPAQVHRATSGLLRMARTPLTETLRADFAAAHLPLKLEDDMRAVQWGKLLLNLNNPVNALAGLPLRDELQVRDYRRVLAALAAARTTPAQVAGAPPRALPRILRLPDWLFRVVAARMLKIDPSARSSMWNDLQAGRPTEIDDLCGAVRRLGAAHGTATPLNAAMQGLIEAHAPGRRYSGAELAAACGLR